MANYQLANDMIDDIMITVVDAAGAIVPAPVGDVFTVVSSDPLSMNAIIATMPPGGPNAGATSLRINAMKKLFTGVTATVSDADGLMTFVLTVDGVADLTPKSIMLDVVDAIHTSQPVPAI
jgi:hypothetical protein